MPHLASAMATSCLQLGHMWWTSLQWGISSGARQKGHATNRHITMAAILPVWPAGTAGGCTGFQQFDQLCAPKLAHSGGPCHPMRHEGWKSRSPSMCTANEPTRTPCQCTHPRWGQATLQPSISSAQHSACATGRAGYGAHASRLALPLQVPTILSALVRTTHLRAGRRLSGPAGGSGGILSGTAPARW